MSHGFDVRTRSTLAPAAALALLAGLPALLPARVIERPEDRAARAQVVAAVDEAPWILDGRWTGAEVPVPQSAVELLRPNAILSRRYVEIDSGRALQVILVHSTDVRDTQGHYPPICYPANGWAPLGEHTGTLVVPGAGPVDARLYHFERSSGPGLRTGIRVVNVFLLPDGGTTWSMDDVGRIAGRRAVAGLGVAQLQVVVDDDVSADELLADAADLLAGLDDLIDSVRRSEG